MEAIKYVVIYDINILFHTSEGTNIPTDAIYNVVHWYDALKKASEGLEKVNIGNSDSNNSHTVFYKIEALW